MRFFALFLFPFRSADDRMSVLIRIDIRTVEVVGCWRSDEIIWACSEWLTVSCLSVTTVKVPLSKLLNPRLLSLQYVWPYGTLRLGNTNRNCNQCSPDVAILVHWLRPQSYIRWHLLHLFLICSFVCLSSNNVFFQQKNNSISWDVFTFR